MPDDARPLLKDRLRKVVRLWWVPATAAVLAGSAAYALPLAAAEDSFVTQGVLSTRLNATSPNDRIDLISDLVALTDLDPALREPAEEAGLTTAELAEALSVEQLENSSFVRVTLTSSIDDEDARRALLRAVVEQASDVLAEQTEPSISIAREDALQRLEEIEEELADILDANEGVPPSDEAAALSSAVTRERISEITSGEESDSLEQLTDALNDARAASRPYNQLTGERDALLVELEASSTAFDPDAVFQPLRLDLVTDQPAEASRRLLLQRTAATAVAAGLMASAVIMLIPTRRQETGPRH